MLLLIHLTEIAEHSEAAYCWQDHLVRIRPADDLLRFHVLARSLLGSQEGVPEKYALAFGCACHGQFRELDEAWHLVSSASN